MMRVLAVPPFEALDPLLPRRAGSDPETREAVRRILGQKLLFEPGKQRRHSHSAR